VQISWTSPYFILWWTENKIPQAPKIWDFLNRKENFKDFYKIKSFIEHFDDFLINLKKTREEVEAESSEIAEVLENIGKTLGPLLIADSMTS